MDRRKFLRTAAGAGLAAGASAGLTPARAEKRQRDQEEAPERPTMPAPYREYGPDPLPEEAPGESTLDKREQIEQLKQHVSELFSGMDQIDEAELAKENPTTETRQEVYRLVNQYLDEYTEMHGIPKLQATAALHTKGMLFALVQGIDQRVDSTKLFILGAIAEDVSTYAVDDSYGLRAPKSEKDKDYA